jgi:hypothetical protein
MDIRTEEVGASSDAATLPEALTFAWLHERVRDYSKDSKPGAGKLERWALWFGMGMAGVGLLSNGLTQWLPARVVLNLLVICLAAEIVGIATSVLLMLKREIRQYIRPRETHASDMDADFEKWQSIMGELEGFPLEERAQRLRFLAALRMRMGERMSFVFGSLQNLGIFPLLIALYLQFRNWEWGNWASAFDVHLVAGLLIWSMALLYGVGWWLIGLRTRVDVYVDLLENSLEH